MLLKVASAGTMVPNKRGWVSTLDFNELKTYFQEQKTHSILTQELASKVPYANDSAVLQHRKLEVYINKLHLQIITTILRLVRINK